MIPITINKRPFKFSHLNKGGNQNNNQIVYQQKISTSTWWLHVGVIACIVIGVLLAFLHWVRYHVTMITWLWSRDNDSIFSTSNERKKKNSNKSVDGFTVALMILVIFNRLFQHLKLYRFTTFEWCQSNTSNWMGETNRNSTSSFDYWYECLAGTFNGYII